MRARNWSIWSGVMCCLDSVLQCNKVSLGDSISQAKGAALFFVVIECAAPDLVFLAILKVDMFIGQNFDVAMNTI